MALLEGMRAGCVPLASKLPGVAEVVGDAGLLCPPRDSVSLASALAKLRDDRDLRAQMASRAVRRADEFRWEDTHRSYLACRGSRHRTRAGWVRRGSGLPQSSSDARRLDCSILAVLSLILSYPLYLRGLSPLDEGALLHIARTHLRRRGSLPRPGDRRHAGRLLPPGSRLSPLRPINRGRTLSANGSARCQLLPGSI